MTEARRGERRVLVIGIDSATFDVIEPLVAEGKLPTMRRLMEEGTWGRLRSTVPPFSAPAWASFITGRNPGSHGIFGFLGPLRGEFERSVTSRLSMRGESLFGVASRNGKRVGVINVPFTYPPEEVNGFVLPGFMGAAGMLGRPATHPRELLQELRDEIGPLRQEVQTLPYFFTDEKDELVQEFYRVEEQRKEATLYLMQRYEWDLLATVFISLDRVQHFFWKYMDTRHPAYDPGLARRYGSVIADFYGYLDRTVEEIIDRAGEDTTVIVLSDHGAGPNTSAFHVNVWLREAGYLRLRPRSYPLWRIRLPLIAYKAMAKLGVHCFTTMRLFPDLKAVSRKDTDPRKAIDPYKVIDWERTRAYGGNLAEQAIYLNVRGREPAGIIESEREYYALLDEIEQGLLALRDPDSGEQVVDKIYRRDDVFSGDCISSAPDLLVRAQNYACKLTDYIYPRHLFERERWHSGSHREEGIFLVRGEGVESGKRLEDACIMDIAPTALHLLGLPVPREMDGRVLEEAIGASFLARHPVSYEEGRGRTVDEGDERGEAIDEEEVEEIKERLRGWGYLG